MAVDGKFKEIKEVNKGFFVSHSQGFSKVFEALKAKMEQSGRCQVHLGDSVSKIVKE